MFRLFLSGALLLGLGLAMAFAGDDAKGLFDKKCSKCHGVDGKGLAKMAKVLKIENGKLDLTSPDTVKASDDDLTKVILDGRKKMPKHKGKLSDSQVKSLVQYIRSLAPSKK